MNVFQKCVLAGVPPWPELHPSGVPGNPQTQSSAVPQANGRHTLGVVDSSAFRI